MESGGFLNSVVLTTQQNNKIKRTKLGNTELLGFNGFRSAVSVWTTYQRIKEAALPGPVVARIEPPLEERKAPAATGELHDSIS